MADLEPFRALRYDPDIVGDVAAVVAPPYDVIDDAYRDTLYARSPFNVVRLILGREADRYGEAARHLGEWRRRGVLALDREPSLYVYVQSFDLDGERRQRSGIIGAVRLESFASGRIRPHERTLAGAKEDRMRVLRACRTNLSPIFGLHTDSVVELDPGVRGQLRSLCDLTDEFDVRHELGQLSNPDLVARISARFSAQEILIADGHHRYETALAYRDHLAREGQLSADDPGNFVMMFLCCMKDPGLVILPTHRVLGGLANFDGPRLVQALRRDFRLRSFPADAGGREAMVAELRAARGAGCLGLAVRGVGEVYLASVASADLMDRAAPQLAPAVRNLDVSLLDEVVLRRALGVEAAAAAQDGRLRYVKGDREALAAVAREEADIALLLNATRIEEVEAVCKAGETMPEKSTYFHPKLLTGLVFRPLEDGGEPRA